MQPPIRHPWIGGCGFALDPGGQWFALGSPGVPTVQIRGMSSGEVLLTFDGSDAGYDFAVTEDGETLVGFGAQIRTWDLSVLDDPYEAVCERVDRDLTREEWAAYVPDLDFGHVEACED